MAYELREGVVTPERYVELREAADMNPKTLEVARRGLPNTDSGGFVVETDSRRQSEMARIDDALGFID